VDRSVSVCFDGVLAESEREAFSQGITSLGGHVSSWHDAVRYGRAYARLRLPATADLRAAASFARVRRVDEPSLVVLEIVPACDARGSRALEHALLGPGRPSGVVEGTRVGDALLIELDASRTPLSLTVDLVEVELAAASDRRITPLLPLDDAVLTAFARDMLRDPAVDASRLIETYTEAWSRETE